MRLVIMATVLDIHVVRLSADAPCCMATVLDIHVIRLSTDAPCMETVSEDITSH